LESPDAAVAFVRITLDAAFMVTHPVRHAPTRAAALAIPLALALALALTARAADAQAAPPNDSLVRRWVRPSEVDGATRRYDAPHYVVFAGSTTPAATLLAFMPGTNGRPANTTDFADVAARQGYRVIGLEYADTPAVGQRCPRDPDPGCAEAFRRKRVFGEGRYGGIDDAPDESVVHRLVALLSALDRAHPTEGWAGYLSGSQPRWDRIAVSGLSQGAGMAAYIATRTPVARVILFSSPWDSYGRDRRLAPWITAGPGATSSDRWYAAYHAREPTANQIERAYAALRIPAAHVRVFTLEPAAGASAAYHPSGVGNSATPRQADGAPAYLEEWKFLLGEG
jgi:hypothetical protein